MQMKKRRIQKSAKQQKIALERINILYAEAKSIFGDDPNLSNRYAQLARKIAMKYKVSMPSRFKKTFCKRCRSYLMPGKNLRIRAQRGHMVYHCLNCRHIQRLRYKK